jgi:hypothetical protein
MASRRREFYPTIHRHIVDWVLLVLLLRGVYDVLKIMVFG